VDKGFPYKMMVRTRANEAASFFAHPWRRQTYDPFQDDQGTESDLEVVMEDVGANDTVGSGSGFEGSRKPEPPRMRKMSTSSMTGHASERIRSSTVSTSTIVGAELSSREE
jgi:hypothetical protein